MNTENSLIGDIRLRFNIEHPSIEECYGFGYECALADLDESDNPYTADSVEYEQWQEGWWAGFYGEKPLFELDKNSFDERVHELAAANDEHYQNTRMGLFSRWLRITGAIAASAVVGYQVIDLVA